MKIVINAIKPLFCVSLIADPARPDVSTVVSATCDGKEVFK